MENAEKVVNPPQKPIIKRFTRSLEYVSLKWLEVNLNMMPEIKQPIKFTKSVPTGNEIKV